MLVTLMDFETLSSESCGVFCGGFFVFVFVCSVLGFCCFGFFYKIITKLMSFSDNLLLGAFF